MPFGIMPANQCRLRSTAIRLHACKKLHIHGIKRKILQRDQTMKRNISSDMTFVYKFPFPIIWIIGFCITTIIIIKTGGFIFLSLILISATVAGTLFLYWGCMRLKVVKMDDEYLYISNFFKEIAVHKNNIAKITEITFINIHPIWIHLKESTEFGIKIMFMPKLRFFSSYSSHPVVQELRTFGNVNQDRIRQ
jgi:hypothetical protein